MTPFLLLLLIGTIEVGTYMYDGIEVGNGARAGVQYGAQSPVYANDQNGIATAVQADAVDLSGLAVTSGTFCTCESNHAAHVSCSGVSPCAASDPRDTYVQDVVAKQFNPFVVFPGLPSSLTITRTASQQVTPS